MFSAKQWFGAITSAVLLVLLLGCAGAQHEATEKYILVATNIKIPYWQSAAAGLYKAASQLKVKADFVGPDSYDPKAQQDAFRKAVAQKPAGIMISVADPEVMKGDIDAAIAQGIPVITIDSDAKSTRRLLYIGTDNYAAGTMGAQVAVRELKGKGNVVVFTMPEQANLNDRLRGYKDVFAAHPQIKISEVVNIKGDPTIAFDRTTEIMEKSPAAVDAFVCTEALACKEVADVLDRKKAAGKTIVAMDTDDLTLNWVQKGSIAATVAQKPYTMAFTGLKVLDDLHHYKLPVLDHAWAKDPFSPIPAFIDTGATLVDKSNLDEFRNARTTASAESKQ